MEGIKQQLLNLYQIGKNYGYSEARSQASELRLFHEGVMMGNAEMAAKLIDQILKDLNHDEKD